MHPDIIANIIITMILLVTAIAVFQILQWRLHPDWVAQQSGDLSFKDDVFIWPIVDVVNNFRCERLIVRRSMVARHQHIDAG